MIKWEDRFSVNVSKIDEEHKFFILIINKVIVAKQGNNKHEKISDALNEMTAYALSHFKSEEAYMLDLDYPEYQQHKEEHKEFIKTTVSFCKRVMNRDNNIIDDLFEYLGQWLVEHIQGTDKKFTECFNKHGLV
ncbi:MAG: hemerythrin family protein [Candidatus Brocadiales bacterium]|nr:hemerythrin family protein [Candidatus Brocadiales bacterium]